MLKFMREKAGSWFIKLILGLIVLVFVFWGVGSFRSQRFEVVASVNGAPISAEDYRQAYNGLLERYRQQFGGNLDENMLKMLNLQQQALDGLVDQSLIRQEAKRLEIRVSTDELVETIRKMPAFQRNGAFDNQLYNRVLEMNRLTPEAFETMQRDSLLIGKMRTFIMDGVNVSDAEAREWYDWNNAEVNLEYVRFAPEEFGEVTATDDEVRAYYDANKENYKTEPRVKARYVAFRTEDFADRAEVTDAEISEYYESNPDEFNEPKTVQARHILLSLEEDSAPELVEEKRKKAEEIMTAARAGEDFAELAKTHSEGPSAERGGDLGTFTKDRMVAPFAEAAFSMEPGEISEPVRTRFGWHVIKVEAVNEAKTTSLDEARESIVDTLKNRKAKNLAMEAAEEFVGQIYDGDALDAVAELKGVTLEETDLFTRAQGPKGLAAASAFSAAAFSLEEGETSEARELTDGYYVIQVTKKEPAEIAPLEDVADRVRADLLRERRDEKAKEAAEAFLAELKATAGGTDSVASDVEEVAEAEPGVETTAEEATADDAAETVAEPAEADASSETAETETTDAESPAMDEKSAAMEEGNVPEFKETGFFGRNGSIPGIGREQEIAQTAFRLTEADPYPEAPVQGRGGYFVLRFKERKAPEAEGFADEKKGIVENLSRQKQFKVFQDWLAQVKGRSEVVVEEGVLN